MNDHAGYAAWRKRAALKLPAGVFVWLDEFLREREADRKRTPDNVSVTLSPMLDADTRAAVLEGLDDCPRCGPDADRATIGYADFVAICRVHEPAKFGGFRVETNGLYVNLPPADVYLTPEERAILSWHPTGQYDKPALPLPCTLGQLRAFLPDAGLLGCLDEEAVEALLGERGESVVLAGEPAPAPTPDTSEDEATNSKIAALFPLVAFAALEKMFPANGHWKKWTVRAGRNGLKVAREKRGLFNPYIASEWWLTKKKPKDWDSEKCLKVLAKNYPDQTQDYHDWLFPSSR